MLLSLIFIVLVLVKIIYFITNFVLDHFMCKCYSLCHTVSCLNNYVNYNILNLYRNHHYIVHTNKNIAISCKQANTHHTHTHVRINTDTHIYTHTRAHAPHKCKCTHTYTHTYTHSYTQTHTRSRAYMHEHTHHTLTHIMSTCCFCKHRRYFVVQFKR